MKTVFLAAFLAVAAPAFAQPIEFKGLKLGSDRATFERWLFSSSFQCAKAGDPCWVVPTENCTAQYPFPSHRRGQPDFDQRMAEHREQFDSCVERVASKRTFAKVSVGGPAVTLFGDRVESIYISFAGEDFPAVLAALTEKYGAPTHVEHPQWQNKAGATFGNDVATWHRADGLISADLRGSERDRSSLTMYAPGVLERREKERMNAAKKALGDM